MHNGGRTIKLVSFALTAGSVIPATVPLAWAQQTTASASEQAGPPAVLEEITVTARKRAENLIDVPLAITALSGEDLEHRGITNLNTLNDFVPGLRYENTSTNRNDRGFNTVTVRGMFPGDSPNRQAATMFVDGVPVPGGAIAGLTDIEHVEVVNGPQSAYFGRSTFSGAINFITRQPGFEPLLSAEASYGSYNSQEYKASVEGPLIQDKLAARLSARYYNTDGQYENYGYTGRLGARKTRSAALSLLGQPTDGLKIRGYFTYWEDTDGPSAQAVLTQADYNCNAGGAPAGTLNYICGGIGSTPLNRMSQNVSPGAGGLNISQGEPVLSGFIDHLGLERKAYETRLMSDYSLGDYTLSGTVAYNSNRWAALTDTYNRPPNGTGYYSTVFVPYQMQNSSGELRLASPQLGRFKFMVGSNYFNERILFETRAWRNSTYSYPTLPTQFTAKTLGLFASASYDFTDQLSLSVEARNQWDKIGQAVQTTGGIDVDETFKSFTPRAILSYKVHPELELYASYARGTRPGSFNALLYSATPYVRSQILAQTNAPFAVPEEKLDMYETGIKGDFFERRLRLLTAFYYGKWRDRQINQNVTYLASPTSTALNTSTVVLPGGAVDLWGTELQATLKLTDNLSLDSTFNYAETDIRATSCTECRTITGVIDPVGNRLPRYPAFTGTLSVTYEHALTDNWKGYARTDYIYTGKQFETEANVAWLDASNRVNLRLGINNQNYTVEIYGANIFDNKTPSNILRLTDPRTGASTIVLAPAERATIGLRVAARY
jgi:iron complex outermembrane receptor protein